MDLSPTMLDCQQPALAVFCNCSLYFLELAQKLANQAGFPVMVLPLQEYPMSTPVRNDPQRFEGGHTIPAVPLTSGNVTQLNPAVNRPIMFDLAHPPSNPRPTPPSAGLLPNAEPASHGGRAYDDGGDKPAASPAKTTHPVCHDVRMDITLLTSEGREQQRNTFRFRWTLQAYPYPNPEVTCLAQKKNLRAPEKTLIEDEMRLYIHIVESPTFSVQPYMMNSRFDFHHPEMESEFLSIDPISFGYDPSDVKIKTTANHQNITQEGGEAGLNGIKPQFKMSVQNAELSASGKETIDEDVTPGWLAKEGNFVESPPTSFVQDFAIWRSQCTETRQKLEVEFGISLVPLSKPRKCRSIDIVRPACRYSHQLHVWVGDKNPRGMILIFTHLIPDICIPEPSAVVGRGIEVEADSTATNVARENDPLLKLTNPEESFGLASAVLPRPPEPTLSSSALSFLKKPEPGQSQVAVKVTRLTCQGWDHTNKKWLQVHWPYLNSKMEIQPNNLNGSVKEPIYLLRPHPDDSEWMDSW
ncbi:hypothetical protein DL96DRAFT_10579 [Flagelloscypha sp. PMI_526]|nr:hypothetical protein DL96DRAFT_10579 [Flagelloscypha sp. PMI_526]